MPLVKAQLLLTFVLGKAEGDVELNCLYLIATKKTPPTFGLEISNFCSLN